MPIDLNSAYQKRSEFPQNGQPKLEIPEGVYQADFIGMGSPFMTFDRFAGCLACGIVDESNPKGPRKKGSGQSAEKISCPDCNGMGVVGKDDDCLRCKGKGFFLGPATACVPCEGTGMLRVKEVALKYVLDTEELIQEAVKYKLSPPVTVQGGKVLSASKLFKRFQTFSNLSDPEEIIQWANELPDEPCIPVTLVVKGDKFPKISDVLKRFEPKK